MATFKITVQKQRTDGYWPVYIRVIHHRDSAFMKTDKMVDSKGIVKSTKEVKDPFVRKACDLLITDYIDRLNKVDTSTWSAQDVVKFLKEGTSDYLKVINENNYLKGEKCFCTYKGEKKEIEVLRIDEEGRLVGIIDGDEKKIISDEITFE